MGDASNQGYTPRAPIYQSEGFTKAEQALKEWCNKTFLSLWSYSNVYRKEKNGNKEVCDLLVVFGDHIILFSDKSPANQPVFPERPDKDKPNVAWERWFRNSILKSARQVCGAEKTIRQREQLFLDPACTQPFPLDLPDPATAKFHRILIAHGILETCRKQTGGSGSLFLKPWESNPAPFTIGKIAVSNCTPDVYFHVFDDHSLPIVMEELDTVTDFVAYLSKKEQLIQHGRLHSATVEENLLAYYLQHYNSQAEHDFPEPENWGTLPIEEGSWEQFANSSRRKEQLKANEESKVWDTFIEAFNRSIFAGEYYFYSSDPTTIIKAEKVVPEPVLRLLAGESRAWRRSLVWMLEDAVRKTPPGGSKYRFIHPKPYDLPEFKNPSIHQRTIDDPCYVYVVRSQQPSVQTSRETWDEWLKLYSLGMKQVYPAAQDIIALAVSKDEQTKTYRIEGSVYLNARNWTKKQEAYIQHLLKTSPVLKNLRAQLTFEKEYPEGSPSLQRPIPVEIPRPRIKGSGRNKPCFCGSGKKYKHCHGL